MKYLKTFERNKNGYKFNVGNYVRLIKPEKFNDKVYKIDKRYNDEPLNNYHLISIDNNLQFWEYESKLRHLTPEELEKLKYDLTTNKYNL